MDQSIEQVLRHQTPIIPEGKDSGCSDKAKALSQPELSMAMPGSARLDAPGVLYPINREVNNVQNEKESLTLQHIEEKARLGEGGKTWT